MAKSRWLLVFLVLAFVLALLIGACGGGTPSSSASSGTTAAPATSTTSAAPASSDTTAPASSETTASTAASAPTETLKIGVILQLTDWYSAVDALEKTDVELCAKMINDEGGIKVGGKAYKVELVEEDGKSTLDGNTTAATKLVLDEKVQLVIGPAAYFNVATSAIFEQNKVLHVASYNGLQPGEMDKNTPYEFLGIDPITQQDVNLKAIRLYYPNVKTVTLASEDSTFPYFKDAFLALAQREGLTLAGDPVLFSTQAEDYNPICAKIKAQNADAVWIAIGIPPGEGAIVKGLRTLGFKAPIAYSGYAPSTIALAGTEACTDIINSLSASYQAPGNPPVLDKILSMGDTKRQWFGMAPDNLYMLKYAIEAADSLDPTAVRDKWQSLDTIPTIYGDGFPTGEQLYGLRHHAWAYPCAVTLINNGQIEHKPWIKPDPTP